MGVRVGRGEDGGCGWGGVRLVEAFGCWGGYRGAGLVEEVEGYHEVASVDVGGGLREDERDGYVVGLVVFQVGQRGGAVGVGAVAVLQVDGEGRDLVRQVGVVEEDVGYGRERVEEGRRRAEEDRVEEGALGGPGGQCAVGLRENVLEQGVLVYAFRGLAALERLGWLRVVVYLPCLRRVLMLYDFQRPNSSCSCLLPLF